MMEELLKAMDEKFKAKEADPNTPMTEKEFHQFEVMMWAIDWAENRFAKTLPGGE
jgi:hypothetical protein